MRITWRTSHQPGAPDEIWVGPKDSTRTASHHFAFNRSIVFTARGGVATRFHVSVWSAWAVWLAPPLSLPGPGFLSHEATGQTASRAPGARSPRPDRIRSGAVPPFRMGVATPRLAGSSPPTAAVCRTPRPPRFVRSAPVSASRPCLHVSHTLARPDLVSLSHPPRPLGTYVSSCSSKPDRIREEDAASFSCTYVAATTTRRRRTRSYRVFLCSVVGRFLFAVVVGWERGARGARWAH